MGMIGGGLGAFIGEVHRIASRMDGHIELVCGAFSSNAEKSKASGMTSNWPEMATRLPFLSSASVVTV